MDNTPENIKKTLKGIKITNSFVEGCRKQFKQTKKLTDKQFEILLSLFNSTANK